MIIQTLKMENFRQYYGEQSITFSSDPKKIVTVIMGENGRGKTSIYRAIMFCIFGDTKLEQDAKESQIILTNTKALSENPNGVSSSVTIEFQQNGQNYNLERKYFSKINENGVFREQLLELKLVNLFTKETWNKEEDIQRIIRKIIDERVKHYFFFDGERIERLTRASDQQKEEVATGIKNLLKIDEVIKARDVLKRVLSKVKKELQQHSTGEYKKALKELEVKEDFLADLRKQEESLIKSKERDQQVLSELEENLKKYEELKNFFQEREQLLIQLQILEDSYTAKIEQLNVINKYLPLLAGQGTISEASEMILNETEQQTVSGITSEFLQDILKDLTCICGNEIVEDSISHRQLKSLQNSVISFEEKKDMHDLLNSLKQLISYLDGRQENMFYTMHEIDKIIEEKEQVQEKLEYINEQLNKNDATEIKNMTLRRNEIIKNIIKNEYDTAACKKSILEHQKNLNTFRLVLKELERRSGIHAKLLIKHEILEKTFKAINNLIYTFEQKLIKELEFSSQKNFLHLLDSAGKNMLKNVVIKNNYSIEVINAFNQPFLANISQGQRQVLSLSFITALAQVSGGKELLEMPLLMDTPFGRLSGSHQKNLIEYLPKICSQWILLVTDREFGLAEEQQFSESGAIGKYYSLNSLEPGVTIIEEVAV